MWTFWKTYIHNWIISRSFYHRLLSTFIPKKKKKIKKKSRIDLFEEFKKYIKKYWLFHTQTCNVHNCARNSVEQCGLFHYKSLNEGIATFNMPIRTLLAFIIKALCATRVKKLPIAHGGATGAFSREICNSLILVT